ncbi:MAG: class I SAM-dependent methyltransferase [Desulfobacterales bacterium]|nr:class I SAM-dependent methyltransferase [Deltaproteobacteria bacterium]NNK95863.1 class I SAM-dependent methyltransferase [Desulfobacterales bacterium]
MSTDSIDAYEKHARNFLQCRDDSKIGVHVANRWARSLRPRANVIEIACGGGVPVTQTLVDAGLRLWAIDSSPTLIAVFKDRFPDVPAQCATVLDCDYFQRKYDAAISIGLIFLLCERDQIRMLGRVSEILHPGTRFLFTAPVEVGTWTDANTGHPCISLGRDAYENALENSGFRVVGYYEDSGKNNYYEVEKVVSPVS